MATIGASLKLFDQFSTTLNQAQQAMDKTIGVADRLKQKLQAKITLDVDTSGAVSHIEQAENRMRSLGAGALKVVIDSSDVARHIEQVRQNLAKSMIQIAIDPGDAVNQAAAIRKQVESQLTTITTRIESKIVLDLDANDIQKQVEAKLKTITTRTEVRITLDVEVQSVAEQMQNRLRSLGSKTMKVIIDSKDIMRGIEQIKQKLGQSVIRIVIDPGDTVSQAAAIRKQIESQLQGIKVRIEIELPAKLQTAFQNIHNLVLRLIRLTKQLRVPSSGAGELQAALRRIEELEKQIVSLQDKLNDKLRGGAREAGGFMSQLKGIAGVLATIAAAKALFTMTVGGAAGQQQYQDTFSARAGNEVVGTAIYNEITRQALKFGQNVDQAMSGSMSFMSNTMNPKKLAELNLLAMRLSKLNPAEGLEGAAFSMKELLSGDYTSIVERFNMGRSMIQDSDALKAGKAGDMDGFIKGMDKLLNQQNMTQAAFEKMLDSPLAKWQKAVNTFKFEMAQAGKRGLEALTPLLNRINQLLESGKLVPFFNALSTGLWLIISLAVLFFEALGWIGTAFQSIWGVAQPFLFAMGGAFALWTLTQIPVLIAQFNAMIVRLWLMLQPIIAQVVAWLTIYWPILLIGAAIGFLVYALYQWEDATAEVTGYVGGAFGILFGFLFNRFAYFGNTIVSVAEFFMNVWKDPIYAVKKLFFDLVINALQYMGNLAKGIEDILNKIPGLKVDITGGMDKVLKKLEDARDNLKSDKDVVKLMRFEQIDYGEAFNKGQDIGKKVGHYAADGVQSAIGAIGDLFDSSGKKPVEAEVTNIPDIGKVGELGKIKDTVDISNEDLRVMRELADMRSIQNFVTLTPTVQVTTGDIRETVDVDDVIHRIVEKTTNEIATSAQGVFG